MAKFLPQKKGPERLPMAIRKGIERKVARAVGAPPPDRSSVFSKPVQIKPERPPVGLALKAGVRPLFSGGRLTTAAAVQSLRRRDERKAAKVSPGARARVVARERLTVRNAGLASKSRALTINPPDPTTDRASGMKKYTSAFSQSLFRAPFQKSYNLRRSYGA